jgi:hypothetical protein
LSKPSRRRLRQNPATIRPKQLGHYKHKQFATVLVILICIPLAGALATAFTNPGYRLGLTVFAAVLVIALFLFSSLTTEVTETRLSWRFGPGLIKKHIDLSEIATAEITKSHWIDGWGIHYTRRGWIYNASGYEAVLVTPNNGRSFLIGSDDAIGLWEAIQLRLDA